MRISDKLYGWTDKAGRICVSLYPASRENRPYNAYPDREAAYKELYARRHRVTGELAYSAIVWEDEADGQSDIRPEEPPAAAAAVR